ncbi:phenylacetate--CoA ligase family protein [Desulforhopalus singaporensis]|uniref:Phenylacetate-CoA ligase n=1 Tax=Desulforhopalus singaporensis TaxID=91360 RepID=A0A1H0T4B1_9BACT|nr:AMP-binding protein [Desulforhopalus singaporensis]SDP48799.1 phenylacetate-CoA ligase [Desulforhopalus singaporensis]
MNKTLYDLDRATALRKSTAEEIERAQLPLLKNHLRQAATVPFYKKLFDGAGLDIDGLQSIKELSNLPFTTRTDLDASPEKFGSGKESDFRDIALTSGTTGEAVIVPYTANDLERLAFNETMGYLGAGVTQEDRLMLTVTLDRCFIAGLAYYSGATRLGATAIRSGPGQPERQWHVIRTLKPRVIVGVPAFLYGLGRWGLENGIDVGRCSIDTIVTIGEPARQADHSPTPLGGRLIDIWQARLASSYGATELETAFCECGQGKGGHVHPELMLVEIVGDDGTVLPNGTSGEVVVTPLGVEGFPLVRFKTGDIARLHSDPCGCGWNSKRLGAVEGRLAQRLKYRGTTIYPEMIFNVLQEIEGVSAGYVEVRLAADGSDDVTVVVGVEKEIGAGRLEESLQARLRVRPQVQVRTGEQVERVMTADGGRKPRKFFDYR